MRTCDGQIDVDPQLLRDRRGQHVPDLPALRADARPLAAATNIAPKSRACARRWRSRPSRTSRNFSRRGRNRTVERPSAHAAATAASKRRRSSTCRTTAAASRASTARPCSSTMRCRASASNGCASSAAATSTKAACERVLEPSADRVEPRCAHFGVCGGCVLQHLAPARQLRIQAAPAARGADAHRQGDARGDAAAAAGRRLELSSPRAARGALGAEEGTHGASASASAARSYIADVKRCEVLLPPVDSLIEPLSLLLTALSVRNRVPQIEVAVADNAVALVVRVLEDADRGGSRAAAAVRARARRADLPAARRLRHGRAADATVTPLEYRLPQFDVTLRFQPTDFVQVNGELNRADGRARRRAAGAGAGRAGARSVLRAGKFLAAARAQRRARRRRRRRCRTGRARARQCGAQRHRQHRSSYAANLAQPSAVDAAVGAATVRQGAARSAAGRRARSAADRRALRREGRAVHLLPSGQPGARRGHPRARAWLYAARRRRDGHVSAYCARRIGGTIHSKRSGTRHDTRSPDDRRAGHDPHRRRSRAAAASAGRRGDPVHAQLREHRAARAPGRGHPRGAHAAAAGDGRSRRRARAALSQGFHGAAADAHHRPRIRPGPGRRPAAGAAVRLADGGRAARGRRST